MSDSTTETLAHSATRTKIFAITGTSVKDTGYISFSFMGESGAEFDRFADICGTWGSIKLRTKDCNEVNPWKLVRGEEGAIGDDGVKRWDIWIGTSDGMKSQGGVDEDPGNEEGFKKLLSQMFENGESAVLLMSRDVFDRFEPVCQALGFEIDAHHFEGELATSK